MLKEDEMAIVCYAADGFLHKLYIYSFMKSLESFSGDCFPAKWHRFGHLFTD